ncbi:DUF5719 family protein [Streptomyces sp. SCL15-4]|uniref:DUF5719 family protein n=1 Tax=Streptomyces sp. SCL15-4 TaxID=2967221 RepID=UPI00296698F4|nr:DUF5719 family protein [Streptomyces sp. SCL15-4]
MNRTTLSLIAGTAALAAVTAFAAVDSPSASGAAAAGTAARLPVERTSLVCPAPSTSDLAETTYTSFTPVTKGAARGGAARLRAAGEQSADGGSGKDGKDGKGDKGDTGEKGGGKKAGQPVLTPKAPGTPATGDTSGGDAPALLGTADGAFAPGWTLQETTEVAAGTGRGLLGVTCAGADTEFWFPGASTAAGRTDYVHLTNPDDSAAVVDIELYGKDGAIKAPLGENLTVGPGASDAVLLPTLTGERQTDLTVHVSVRSGRVGAAVRALDDKAGGDWLAPAADPAADLVLPGIPKDATDVRLIAFTPGDDDADLKIRLASPDGLITPAGHESAHVKSGMTAAVDLGDVTRGEAGSLVLTPTGQAEAVPVVAALQVVRGKGDQRETAFIPATAAVGTRATSAGNSAKGTTLALAAPEGTATVKVTASAGSEGGTPAAKTYTIKSGTTQNVDAPVPTGLKGTYALTLEPVSGGPLYASRTLGATTRSTPAFTIQTLPTDHGLVSVPETEEDLSILQK